MAFNDREISTQDGRPAALYAFRWGLTYWRYTSADRAITIPEFVDGQIVDVTYEPRAISDNGMVQGSSSQNDFQVDGPSDLPIRELFRGTPPSEDIWLTVRRIHAGDSDAPIYWKGLVMNVRPLDVASMSIIAQPLSATMGVTGLRLCWTRECPHFLYDVNCKVDKEAYRSDTTVAATAGNLLTVSSDIVVPSDWFRGGFLEWQASAEGTLERRMIEQQNGRVFRLLGLTDGLANGVAIRLYPGCDRVPTTCDGRFDNMPNYGGFDKMPGDTPFGKAIW